MKKTIKYTLYTLSSLLFLFTLYLMIFGSIAIRNNKLVNIFGYSYGFVPTNSMEGTKREEYSIKTIKEGSIILVKLNEFDNLKLGDVIVYKSNDGKLIVHRIINKEEGNEITYQTKGDNNTEIDEDLVSISNYQGKVIKTIYLFGLGNVLKSYQSMILLIFIVIIIIMIIVQIYELVKNYYKKEELSDEELNKIVEERLKGLKNNEKDNY